VEFFVFLSFRVERVWFSFLCVVLVSVYVLVVSGFSVICLACMSVFGLIIFGAMCAQQRLVVLWAAPMLPFVSTAMRPMEFLMWRRWLTSVMEFSTASCAVWPVCIWSQVCLAKTRRMATSPMPVALQAPVWLSA